MGNSGPPVRMPSVDGAAFCDGSPSNPQGQYAPMCVVVLNGLSASWNEREAVRARNAAATRSLFPPRTVKLKQVLLAEILSSRRDSQPRREDEVVVVGVKLCIGA